MIRLGVEFFYSFTADAAVDCGMTIELSDNVFWYYECGTLRESHRVKI